MYAAKDIAKYIVNRCIERCRPISNLQLQKILYFCQRDFKQIDGSTLFRDDFEAWQYGPVIPSVYRMFSLFGGMKINRRVREEIEIDPDTRNVINRIVDKYSGYPAWDLVSMTHKKGDPWDQVFKDGKGNKRTIRKELIFG